MSNYWEVEVLGENVVVIAPPTEIDKKHDDLLLRVTGNMLEADKIEMANEVVNALNAYIDS